MSWREVQKAVNSLFLLGRAWRWARQNAALLGCVFAVVGLVALRLTSEQDLRLSISTDETDSYLAASQVPLWSWDFVTSIRPVTIPLVLKVLEPRRGYRMTVISNPASEAWNPYVRRLQPGFDRMVVFQTLFAVICWSALALSLSSKARHPVVKVAVTLAVLLFAFSPPVSDWDSVIDSFSLTFSLLALAIAFLTQAIFWVLQGGEPNRGKGLLWIVLTALSLTAYVFVRDTNQYILPVTVLLALPALIWLRPRYAAGWIAAVCVFWLGVFAFGLWTARQSLRWTEPLSHAYEYFVFAHPVRVQYFEQKLDMPALGSEAYTFWYRQNGPQAYIRFLIMRPRYIVTELTGRMEYFFSENIQPYYHRDAKSPARQRLLGLGDIFHPKSGAIFYLDLILLAGLGLYTWQVRTSRARAWFWLAGWWLASASLMLFFSYFFDTWGVIRHVVYSVQMYRLFLWLYLLVWLDLLLTDRSASAISAG